MDDLISRQAAIEALEREKTYCTAFRDGYTPINVFEKYNAGLTDGIKALKNLPSAHPAADVVEVVRCKDCDCWNESDVSGQKGKPNYRCACTYWASEDGFNCYTDPNDFCSNGERREDGQAYH